MRCSARLLLGWLALCCVAARVSAQAEAPDAPSPPGADDALGFGDMPAASDPAASFALDSPAPAPRVQEEPSPWMLSGSVRVQGALRLEQGGVYRLGKLRQVFAPRLEYARALVGGRSLRAVASGRAEADFAYLLSPEAYDAATQEIYGSQLIPGETFLALLGQGFELSFGEQIVTFGQGEVLSTLDVVNPRDLREPLFADLDELRLPLLMTRAGFSFANLRLQLLVVHEPYFGLLPPPLGELSPFRKLLLESAALASALGDRELRNRHLPGRGFARADATQLHARLSWQGSRVDLALQAASLLDGLGIPRLPAPEAFAEPQIGLPVYHPRYGLLGHSGALGLGPVVLRWEATGELNRPLTLRPIHGALPLWTSERFDVLRGMLGVTYAPSTQTSVSFELLQSYVLDHPARRRAAASEPLFPVEAMQIALRANHQFMRERAYLTLVAIVIGVADFNAWAARLELGYALLDSLKLALGLVTYRPSEDFGVFFGFERNDRVFCNLRWDLTTH